MLVLADTVGQDNETGVCHLILLLHLRQFFCQHLVLHLDEGAACDAGALLDACIGEIGAIGAGGAGLGGGGFLGLGGGGRHGLGLGVSFFHYWHKWLSFFSVWGFVGSDLERFVGFGMICAFSVFWIGLCIFGFLNAFGVLTCI